MDLFLSIESRLYGRARKIQGCCAQNYSSGSTFAMCNHFLSKLHDVTFGRSSNPLMAVSLLILLFKSDHDINNQGLDCSKFVRFNEIHCCLLFCITYPQ